MNVNFPNEVGMLASTLIRRGFQCYLVGGCIRDSILNKPVHDWDMCTDATPEQIAQILKKHYVPVDLKGMKYGTVAAVLDGKEYEITAFRSDASYSDGRHPDGVEFVKDIQLDLSRRDFTINAIAYNMQTGDLVDPFNGQEDIKKGIIRAVGNPDQRIREDSLRILRGMRFAIKYGYDIDFDTCAAFHKNCNLLQNLSKERVTDELRKILTCGENVLPTFMEFSDVILTIFPDMERCYMFDQNNKYHQHDVYEHLLSVTDACDTDKFEIKIAALLHDIGKPLCYTEDNLGWGHFYGHAGVSKTICENLLNRDLCLTKAEKERVLLLVQEHDHELPITTKSMRKFVSTFGTDFIDDWVVLKKADISDHVFPKCALDLNKKYELMYQTYMDFLESEKRFTLKDLNVNGTDLINKLNMEPGKGIGQVLNQLLEDVLNEDVPNEREALLQRAFSLTRPSNEEDLDPDYEQDF